MVDVILGEFELVEAFVEIFIYHCLRGFNIKSNDMVKFTDSRMIISISRGQQKLTLTYHSTGESAVLYRLFT